MQLLANQPDPWRYDVERIEVEADSDFNLFMKYCDNTFAGYIQTLAKTIIKYCDMQCFILLAGPSASGKTTAANMLKNELERRGTKSLSISMDNFFKPADKAPFLENGERDYESINALDTDALHDFICELILHGKALMPLYDFANGTRDKCEQIVMNPNTVVILEGIHALNPKISENFEHNHFYKVYITASGEFYRKTEILLTKKELRLTRRIIRDYIFRGSSINNTLTMWHNVIAGERKYIKPYKNNADFFVYSTLAYEPYVYKNIFNEIVQKYSNSKLNPEALKLAEKLSVFKDYSSINVSADSLINEFIGE